MNILQLDIVDFASQDSWRWVLADASGSAKETFTVSLRREDPEYAAFNDAYATVRYSSVPDRDPIDEETRILSQLGDWISEWVFGPIVRKLVDVAPVTVFVNVPFNAERLVYRPFELAHVDGRPIACQNVTLVYRRAGDQAVLAQRPVDRALRVLAVFSLPTDAATLNLRRERFALEKLADRISNKGHLAVEVRVVQYGTGRDRFREVLNEPEGWDIVHFSGHGVPGTLVLERQGGGSDVISTSDLLDMLRPIRRRVKLVVMSACESAAPALRAAAAHLGLDPLDTSDTGLDVQFTATTESGLAWTVAETLECAVLAMRFPVADEFAVQFSASFYEALLERRFDVPSAMQDALTRAAPGPLSAGTPALFAWSASDPPLAAPGRATAQVQSRSANLPPASEHFVGRVDEIARSAAALEPGSGRTGVLFYGMAGAGKTACAVELVHSYDTSRFDALVWFKAPDDGADVTRALLQFALTMERSVANFQMVHAVEYLDEFNAWLPALTHLLTARRILIVMDNLESLLARDGNWIDSRWASVVAALVSHEGASRVVMTCRQRPVQVDEDDRILVLAVQTLSLAESILLAGQLPDLRRLLRDDPKSLLRILKKTQGHPKLLEFADKQAARPSALGRLLDASPEDIPDTVLEAFFGRKHSSLGADDFSETLEKWTCQVASSLAPAALLAFHFVCTLEEEDRDTLLIFAAWSDIWRAVGQPDALPDHRTILRELAARGLIELAPNGTECRIHPVVAQTGRSQAGAAFARTICVVMAGIFALQNLEQRRQELGQAVGMDGVVSTSLRAVPYCLRQGNWEHAAAFIEIVLDRDRSPVVLDIMLPLIRRIVAETEGTREGRENAGLLAKALVGGRRHLEAETVLRALIEGSSKAGETAIAFAATSDLADLLFETGRSNEARRMLARAHELRDDSASDVNALADEAEALQRLAKAGHHQEVLEKAQRLRETLSSLPEQEGDQGRATSWNIREMILSAARLAAVGLNEHQQVLSLNAELLRSQMRRGAPGLELALTRYHDYLPLLRLNRREEARALLQECRQVFETEEDLLGLAAVFSGLAAVEHEDGNLDQAVTFAKTSLRFCYKLGDPERCGNAHLKIASYLDEHAGAPNARMSGDEFIACLQMAIAHLLAAGILFLELEAEPPGLDLRRWSPGLTSAVVELATQLSVAPMLAPWPADFDAMCKAVARTDGVRFGALYETLMHRYPSGDKAMVTVIQLARQLLARVNEAR